MNSWQGRLAATVIGMAAVIAFFTCAWYVAELDYTRPRSAPNKPEILQGDFHPVPVMAVTPAKARRS